MVRGNWVGSEMEMEMKVEWRWGRQRRWGIGWFDVLSQSHPNATCVRIELGLHTIPRGNGIAWFCHLLHKSYHLDRATGITRKRKR